MGVDELPGFDVADLPPVDQFELLVSSGLLDDGPLDAEAVDAEVVAAQDGEPPPFDEDVEEAEAPVAVPPPSLDSYISGPTPMGYCTDTRNGRVCMRVTQVFNRTNVAIKCYTHSGKCTLAIPEWKLPPLASLRAWAARAQPVPAGASVAVKDAAIATHLGELKALRDQAVWPGRSRQSLVDEAA
jgi:hypothetical protein